MKTLIEVKEFTPTAGTEFTGTSWPGPGIYRTMSSTWFLVYLCGSSLCAVNLGVGTKCPIQTVDEPQGPKDPTPVITASDLLKAVAISQNPLLAKELLR